MRQFADVGRAKQLVSGRRRLPRLPLELDLLPRRRRASGRARVLRSDQTRVG